MLSSVKGGARSTPLFPRRAKATPTFWSPQWHGLWLLDFTFFTFPSNAEGAPQQQDSGVWEGEEPWVLIH